MAEKIKDSVVDFVKDFLPRKKQKIVHQISDDSLNEKSEARSLALQHAEDIGKIAKLEKELAETRKRKKDKLEEKEIKKSLNQQIQKHNQESKSRYFSLKMFFYRYFNDEKFRKNLGVYSFDRQHKLANFGDIGISPDGYLTLLDNQHNVIWAAETAKDVFQSPSAIPNDISSNKIIVNLDKDFVFMENVMNIPIYDTIKQGSKSILARMSRKNFYDIIREKNIDMSELRNKLEDAEALNVKQKEKIDKLESAVKMHEQMSENARANLSLNEGNMIAIDRAYRYLAKDILRYQNTNAVNSGIIRTLEAVNKQLLDAAEKSGGQVSFDDAMEKVERAKILLEQKNPLPLYFPNNPIKEEKGGND